MGSLLAATLLPIFLWVPGYALAWLLDLFDFRRRTAGFRAALSLPLSIALCPIATCLLGTFGSMTAVWAAYGAMAVVFLFAHSRTPWRIRMPDGWVVFGGIALVWLGVALLSLVDLQWGNRLYYPLTRSTIRFALMDPRHQRHGNPAPEPAVPACPPGGAALPLLLADDVQPGKPDRAAMDQRAAGGNRRDVLVRAGNDGAARDLPSSLPGEPERAVAPPGPGGNPAHGYHRARYYSRAFLPVPVLPGIDRFRSSQSGSVERVCGLVSAQHHLGSPCRGRFDCRVHGLPAGGSRAQASSRHAVPAYGLLAGVALASAIGISIWVAFVFGIFLILWTAVCAWRRWWRETPALLVAGLTSILLAWPYLNQIMGPGSSAGAAGTCSSSRYAFFPGSADPQLARHERVDQAQPGKRVSASAELLSGVRLVFPDRHGQVAPISHCRQAAGASGPGLCLLLATSLLICTFLKSVIAIRPRPARASSGAVRAPAVVGGHLDCARRPEVPPARLEGSSHRVPLPGAAGTVYDLALTRVYPILADRAGSRRSVDGVDRRFGERTYAAREAYEWARAATGENAVIQFNPDVWYRTPEMLYGDRRVVAADTSCKTLVGGDPAHARRLSGNWPGSTLPPASPYQRAWQRLPEPAVDLFVAKDTDPVWADRQSWVWTEKPLFANRYLRLFGCVR